MKKTICLALIVALVICMMPTFAFAAAPGATQPGATQPGATQPGATQPGPTQPGPTQPGPTQPGPTQPGPTQPGPTNPGGSTGGGYFPPIVTAQKPVIESNADVTTSLSADGTTLTIKAKEGFEIVDVTVNGVSKGAVTTVTGLKTGDKVVIVTKAIEEPTEAEKKIAACKETKLVARSQAVTLKSGKKAIKITWKAKEGALKNIDGVQIFRSTKRADGTYKKVFTSKSGKYINTAVKKGQMYYYKVRGYVRVDGKLYFTKYSTKAWRRV